MYFMCNSWLLKEVKYEEEQKLFFNYMCCSLQYTARTISTTIIRAVYLTLLYL